MGPGRRLPRILDFFFFSSRRRHTRLQGDWSSDVCSSDLQISSGTDFNHNTYTWPAENNNYAYFPAARFDAFLTKKQQFTWSWNYRHNWQEIGRASCRERV